MQVSLPAGDLGRVLVRANLSRNSLSAQIDADSPLLGAAIASHLPAAEQKLLGEHGMRAAFTLANPGAGGSATNDASSQTGQRERPSEQQTSPHRPFAASVAPFRTEAAQDSDPRTAPAEGRINIRI